ncbi:IS701 family transposase [Streptomyces sp. NPDC058092]|uniref:IS701 family transposase n=1 Tax=Streptomyces sp. NPDC058092 TaxID=3346336 RepID=UPI0036E0C2BD
MGGDLEAGDVWRWVAGLEEVHERFVHRFQRSEPRESALAYMHGLVSSLERKNAWTVAERAGHDRPDRLQRLLNTCDWDADEVRDDVREFVVGRLGDRQAVLIVDDTGFLKKGVRSAGVQRQYTGTAGRVENSQVGTFLAYATNAGHTLIDRELYLPASWTDDRERCRAAAIPDEVAFATKIDHAKAMIERALAARVPFAWLTADEAYGQVKGLRYWLEQRGVFHVLATRRTDTVVTSSRMDHPVDELVAGLPRQAWKRRSCGRGAHGERVYDWARAPIRPWREEGVEHWVLARRSITDPTEIAYYVCFAPEGTALNTLLTVAGRRWTIEECFQTAKNECGLDHYQVRKYHAWYRHITLAMAAHAYLTTVRVEELKKGDQNPEKRTSSR